MIDGLKPYLSTRGSGLAWLPTLPATWGVRRNGGLFAQRNETGSKDLPLLEVSLKTGVSVRGFEGGDRKQVLANRSGYKLASRGDLAYNTMRMWQGAVGLVPIDGLVSPAYIVARPFEGVDPAFFQYLFRTTAYLIEVDKYSRGIVKDRNRLYWEDFKQMSSPVPPPAEQTAIVRFLDHAGRNIRRAISGKLKLLQLIDEQVTVVVGQALQQHGCATARLGTLVNTPHRLVERKPSAQYVALGLRNRGRGIFHKASTAGEDLGDSTFYWVQPGDLLISGQFAWEGAVAIACSDEKDTVVSHRYHVFQGVEGTSTTQYLWSLLRSDFGSMLLDQHSRGAAGRNRPLNIGTLLKERVPIIPFKAQLALGSFIESTVPIRVRAASEIALLREYSTRLIADVVTGKLDVREAAANLPDEPTPGADDLVDQDDELEDDAEEESAEAEE